MVARSARSKGDFKIVFGGYGDVIEPAGRPSQEKLRTLRPLRPWVMEAEKRAGVGPSSAWPSPCPCPGSCYHALHWNGLGLVSPIGLSTSSLNFNSVDSLFSTPQWTLRNRHADDRASSKLFADAELEERAERARAASLRTTTLIRTPSEHPNWTGDESIEDAVLRMLVDKYKPLRTGTIRTAEEKIRRAPTQVAAQQPEISPMSIVENDSAVPSPSQSRVYRAGEPLLPAVEGHKPWLITFKVPSHATASIRHGHFPTTGSPSSSETSMRNSTQTGPVDSDRERRKERDVKKRSEFAGRLTRAKESSLDYRLGITKDMKSGVRARPNPVSIKGWAGLVEERIEVRRKCVALHR